MDGPKVLSRLSHFLLQGVPLPNFAHFESEGFGGLPKF